MFGRDLSPLQRRLKDSFVYKLYLKLRYPKVYEERRKEREFYKSLLDGTRQNLIFDCGANCGDKLVIFAALARKVVAIEPSPAAAEGLRIRFRGVQSVTIVESGLAAEPGEGVLYLLGEDDPCNTFSTLWREKQAGASSTVGVEPLKQTVELTTLDAMRQMYGDPDYVKIDVEGFELEVVKGMSFAPDRISFEVNLPEFLVDAEKIIQMLSSRATYHFLISKSDPPLLLEDAVWLNAEEVIGAIDQSNSTYIEVFGRRT